ncbi:hypothetical protein [Campylobacter coli]|uniref:hypothetical protein n=1 Tax=Campylobacter coli TaxID=195 RepID=UPI00403347ED
MGGYLFFFGLIILFALFDSDFWEFFKFFLQIRMILIPLRVVFIILVPFHLENSFLGKTFYFLENLFCLAFAILLIVAIIVGGKIKCRKRKIKCRIFATNYLSFNLKLKL